MKTLNEIEKLTDETLASLDAMQQAEANPYLYSKIVGRMQAGSRAVPARGMRLMLGLTFVLLLLLCINVFSYQLIKGQREKSRLSGISAFSQAYFQQDNNYSY